MSNAYRVTIDEPITVAGEEYGVGEQIAATVYEAEQRAAEQDKEIAITLDHQEPPVAIRGRREAGSPRRPDGGQTWYHNNTGCYMRATPQDGFDRDHYARHAEWGEELRDVLEDVGYAKNSTQYDRMDADVYVREAPEDGFDTQIMGTSLNNGKDVEVARACWYEENPRSPEVTELLEADGFVPEFFYERIEVPEESILTYLDETLDTEPVSADTFLSADSLDRAATLQERDYGDVPGSCVLGTKQRHDQEVVHNKYPRDDS